MPNGTNASLLEVESVCSGYGRGQVLFDVSLAINEGEQISLMGRNGMGKTTLIRTIMGQLPQNQGQIHFNSIATRDLPIHKIAALGIGWVPEGRLIFPSLSVEENLVATAQTHRTDNAERWMLNSIYELFPRLKERRKNGGNQLSGGEQQMLAIGRALMTNPRLLILDEATEGLSPKVRQEIWETLRTIKNKGQSILVVDKDVKAIGRVADKHYILEKGRVVWKGDTSTLLDDEQSIRKYVGV